MTDIRCIICSKPILDFDQWFDEPCPGEAPQDPGHKVGWAGIAKLLPGPVLDDPALEHDRLASVVMERAFEALNSPAILGTLPEVQNG